MDKIIGFFIVLFFLGVAFTLIEKRFAANKHKKVFRKSWKLDFYKDVHDAYVKHRTVAEDDERFPVLPERFVRDVRKVMPENGIVTLDNGVYKIWFARNYPAYSPNTLLLDNALASMGAGLPSAIGAKLVHPDVPVVSVCGDGGFMMNSQELETAVRLNLDLVVIVLRDDAYGMIKWKQSHMQLDNFGLDYGNPDLVSYAQSYGAKGWRIEQTSEVASTLKHCLETPGVHLIDCPVDYSLNDETLNRTIKELSDKL